MQAYRSHLPVLGVQLTTKERMCQTQKQSANSKRLASHASNWAIMASLKVQKHMLGSNFHCDTNILFYVQMFHQTVTVLPFDNMIIIMSINTLRYNAHFHIVLSYMPFSHSQMHFTLKCYITHQNIMPV